MMMPAKGKREMDEERDGPFTGEMFEAEVARNRPSQALALSGPGVFVGEVKSL